MIRPLLHSIFAISLFIFMVGNLSAMGLQLRVAEACAPFKNARFVVATLFGGFVIGPALAYLVVLVIPMTPPYATGVMLLGMAPSAPFLPLVVRKANGDAAAAAGVMLLASLGTILIMPLGVPLVASDLSATVWSIAKPLLSMILLPLVLGILIKSKWDRAADRIYKYVKGITAIGTIVFLLMVIILHFKAFLGSVGSHALLAQLVYVPALGVAGYMIAVGMPESRRSVMSLGMCTRNIGAAAAIVGANGDQRIMVSLVMATLVTVAFSFAVAPWFSRAAAKTARLAGGQGRVQLQPRQ